MDPGHPLYRVCKEWHARRTLPMSAVRPTKLGAAAGHTPGGGAAQYSALEAAELLLQGMQAEDKGLATLRLEAPPKEQSNPRPLIPSLTPTPTLTLTPTPILTLSLSLTPTPNP